MKFVPLTVRVVAAAPTGVAAGAMDVMVAAVTGGVADPDPEPELPAAQPRSERGRKADRLRARYTECRTFISWVSIKTKSFFAMRNFDES
jgi:hypothetical protein